MARIHSAMYLLALGVSPLALIAAATPAAAEAVAAPVGAAPVAVTEVVVTAQRRAESLKTVPISVQALTADQIGRQGIATSQDLAAMSPTVNFQAGNSASATAFSLRGVSSVAVQSGFQPSTALVLDGVAVAKQNEFILDLGDIERIEILNGPQGTLFGKNSTAGVINIVTKAPAREFQAMVQGTATTDDEYGFKAMLNAPLSDRVRLRLNGFVRDQQPLIKNLTATSIDGAKSWGIDGKLAIDLSDNVDLLLDVSRSHLNSSYGQFLLIGPAVFGAAQAAVVGPVYGKRLTNTHAPAEDISNTTRVTGTLHWRASDTLDIVSISNYTKFDERSVIDSGGTPAGADVGVGESLPTSTYPFKYVNYGIDRRRPESYHYYSEEARANYESGPIKAVAGFYHQSYVNHFTVNLAFNLDGSLVGRTPGQRFFSTSIPVTRLSDKTTSVFGDLTYALSDQFKVFGGLRYTWETVSVDYHRDDFLTPYSNFNVLTGAVSAAPFRTITAASTHHLNNLSGRAGIQYQPTSDLNFYATYSRGYKAPAADTSTSLKAGVDPIIAPEHANAYEVGGKLRLFDNRVAVNVAVFHEKIDNIQESVVAPDSPTLQIAVVNAGSLTTKGVEADAQVVVTPNLRFNGGLAYVDTAYGGGFSTPCSTGQIAAKICNNRPLPGAMDTTGQQAVGAPKWKYSVAGDYENQLPGHDIGYYAHIDWTWNSSTQYLLGDDPLGREPSRGVLNASVGLRGPDNRWELQLFGRNLTDDFYYAARLDIPTIGQPLGFLGRDFHRYAGVRLTLRR